MASSSVVDKSMDSENRVEQIQLLDATLDAYDGVTVEMKDPIDSNLFSTLLKASISQWRQKGKKGVWIKLPIQLAYLIDSAVKEGFQYHHAEKTYLMLVYWIPKTPRTIPANASDRVGISAFTMNDIEEFLVVQEIKGRFRGTNVWNTGVVDEGEDICAGAIREMKEETRVGPYVKSGWAKEDVPSQSESKEDLIKRIVVEAERTGKPRDFKHPPRPIGIDRRAMSLQFWLDN